MTRGMKILLIAPLAIVGIALFIFIGGEIVDSTSVTMAVTAEPGGVWTTVIAASILI